MLKKMVSNLLKVAFIQDFNHHSIGLLVLSAEDLSILPKNWEFLGDEFPYSEVTLDKLHKGNRRSERQGFLRYLRLQIPQS